MNVFHDLMDGWNNISNINIQVSKINFMMYNGLFDNFNAVSRN